MPRRVRLATLLAFVLHGVLILTARYRLSYDAYTHMLFGDHYRLDWWSLWETRWYTGFEVTSYPPLVHQLIALFGLLLGVDAAFALILWIILTAYPIVIYNFCRIFTGKTIAGYAALGVAVLPSIYQTAHTYGQLPTLVGTLFGLLGMVALNDYLQHGNRLSGALAVALIGAMIAAHHASILLLPWVVGAVVLHLLLNHPINKLLLIVRLAIFGILASMVGVLVIWPFWIWGMGQTLQTPIDHLSRHNFFVDPYAPVALFLPVYGPLIPLIPFAIWKGFRREIVGLWAAFLILFLLGLGGTTPLPRWLFGRGWEWLTYDRFAFWAALMLLPFFGMAMVKIRKRLSLGSKVNAACWREWVKFSTFLFLGVCAIISGLLPTLLPTQPPQIDMQPIVKFLAEDDRSNWRYVTYGMGDQFAYLNRLTKATTIDGSYHSARTLPELQSSGIGQIDTAYWLPHGLSMLDPILEKSGERGVRWGFVNRADFIPILQRNGWVKLTTLTNNVQVWENPQAIIPPPVQPPAETPLAVFSWGVLPLSALLLATAFGTLRLWPVITRRVLLGLHSISIGLMPVGLCFWYFITLAVMDHSKVYFTYDHALIFTSDAIALMAFLSWVIPYVFGPKNKTHQVTQSTPRFVVLKTLFSSIGPWFFCLCLLASLSTLWSLDWRASLYISLHLWLVFGLFLSLQDRPESWRYFALGSMSAVLLQALFGFWQFAAQSTAFMAPLRSWWPGNLQPGTTGASVVQLLDGTRWLRVYGSLPHPNILGGLVFFFLAGLIAFYLFNKRHRLLITIISGAGLVLLVLTFSRSAWLGSAVFALLLTLQYRRFEHKRLFILAVIGLFSLAWVAISLKPMISTRIGLSARVRTEEFSSKARAWLVQESLQFIRERPLSGLGVGSFILELAQRASYGYIVEPVHNVPLLVISELGIGGGLLLSGFFAVLLVGMLRARRPETVLFSAALMGLFVISSFDHYLWTLAPGRMLWGLAMGLWAGQVRQDERGG